MATNTGARGPPVSRERFRFVDDLSKRIAKYHTVVQRMTELTLTIKFPVHLQKIYVLVYEIEPLSNIF